MKCEPSAILRVIGILVLAGISAQARPLKPVAPLELRIDPSVSHGVWEGWGTSLCWMGNVFGQQDDIADFLFTTKPTTFKGKSVPGLGLNIVRYNAGACSDNEIDGRKMKVSKIIRKYRQMEGFWLDGKNPDPTSASWDWSVDANQRAMLLKARDRGANRFELFSNSPMWWMCANDNPSGAANANDDNLPEKNYQAFAIYLATVAKVTKERWGVPFTSIASFNEPMSSWWFADCKQEGCHFSREAQAKMLPILRAELVRQRLGDLAITASDETHYDRCVLCIPARDPADEIAAMMLAQVLEHDGYCAEYVSVEKLASEYIELVEKRGVQIVFVSALPPAAVTHARYIAKRLRSRFPDLKIIVGLWAAEGDIERARQRLASAGTDLVVGSMEDAREKLRQTVQPLLVGAKSEVVVTAE